MQSLGLQRLGSIPSALDDFLPGKTFVSDTFQTYSSIQGFHGVDLQSSESKKDVLTFSANSRGSLGTMQEEAGEAERVLIAGGAKNMRSQLLPIVLCWL